LIAAVVAGLTAGGVSLLIGELVLSGYKNDLFPTPKLMPTPDEMRRLRDARIHSTAITFATMGGLLGLAMGFAGGLVRHSTLSGVKAALLGAVLGTAVAGCTASVIVPIFFEKYDPQSGSLVLPLLTHGAIWSTVGAIGGLAFGLGLGDLGRWKATVAGGLLGAAAATVVYEISGALAFPSSKTDLPLSSSMIARGMAQLLVAILSAIGAAMALHQSPKSKAPSSVRS
jgi:hypothetical protein